MHLIREIWIADVECFVPSCALDLAQAEETDAPNAYALSITQPGKNYFRLHVQWLAKSASPRTQAQRSLRHIASRVVAPHLTDLA
jgi:hypothetical protein